MPGHLEIDLVHHCGSSPAGQYVHTLQATDVATGWTEIITVRSKGERIVATGLAELQLRFPFHIAGIHSDNGAEFIMWPESSTPFYFEEDPAGTIVRNLARTLGKPILLGSDEFEHSEPPRHYNSAFILDTHGATAAVYRKIHLVPFGEYVPFQRLLFFVGPLVEAVSAFSRGTRVTMMPVEGHMVSTAICYEVTYPALSREAVRNGSEMLTTVTNDAWYGDSSAAYQHFEMAAMRAIEQGRYLARAANTGISGIIDPYGRVLVRTNLFETVAVVGEARFVQAKTVYARIGDLVAHVSMAITLLALFVAIRGVPFGRRHR